MTTRTLVEVLLDGEEHPVRISESGVPGNGIWIETGKGRDSKCRFLSYTELAALVEYLSDKQEEDES